MRVLLLSNSTQHGQGYLDHAWAPIARLLSDVPEVTFIPWALRDHEGYTAKVRARFEMDGMMVRPVPLDKSAAGILEHAQAVFIGGGNTFRLVHGLQQTGIMRLIRKRVQEGMPYLGASAGTNVAAPTIRTTNDMPIVQPASFDALGLIPFQINPHYVDPEPGSIHMGETREQRLLEYLEENERPVVGLREGAWLEVEGPLCRLVGVRGARLFRRGEAPKELTAGADLSFLLGAPA
jgi:dipeptidase E